MCRTKTLIDSEKIRYIAICKDVAYFSFPALKRCKDIQFASHEEKIQVAYMNIKIEEYYCEMMVIKKTVFSMTY